MGEYSFFFLSPSQSKTYDTATEKYLDFSFEKTNSAYMLFYERVEPKEADVQQTGAVKETAAAKEEQELRGEMIFDQEKETVDAVAATTQNEDQTMTEVQEEKVAGDPDIECDIVDKEGTQEMIIKNNESEQDGDEKITKQADEQMVSSQEVKGIQETLQIERSSSSGICKELEDWIWQDNKNFLQDVNIFEHTYFK